MESSRTASPLWLGKISRAVLIGGLALFGLMGAGCGSSGSGNPPPTSNIALGQWGGAGINMVVSATGATTGYHCATGTVDNPIIVDATGHFSDTGTTRQSGPASTAHPTAYTGTVTGTTMTLNVTISPAVTATSYTLTQGVVGDVTSGGVCPR